MTRDVCALGVALMAVAAWLGGVAGAAGVGAGVALALANFRWLVARACASTTAAGGACALWSVGAGLRFAVLAAACAALLAAGWTHPVALLAGLTVLPCAVIGHGLRAARQEA